MKVTEQVKIQKKEIYLAHLIHCAVNGKQPEEKPDCIIWKDIFDIAKMHSILGTLFNTILTLKDQPDKEIMKKWQETYYKTFVKEISFDAERKKLLEKLDLNGIRYLPLKGVILKEYYAKPGMRMFADNDILYDKDKMLEVRDIMLKMGYDVVSIRIRNHDVYNKKPIFSFEMHRSLVPLESPYYEYFNKIWKKAIRDKDNNYGFHLSQEDFYVYFITHYYSHFSKSGCGIRSLIDEYVYMKQEQDNLNWEYVYEELRKLKLDKFEKMIKKLSFNLFENMYAKMTGEEEEIYKQILNSGTYGTVQMLVNNRLNNEYAVKSKRCVKFRYYLRRVFPDMKRMKSNYPIVEKYSFCYPFIIVYRWFKFFKHYSYHRREIKEVHKCKVRK